MFTDTLFSIAIFYRAKYQRQARAVGVQQAARNLRKQGVPLEIALHLLVR